MIKVYILDVVDLFSEETIKEYITVLWSSIFVTLVAKKYHLSIKLPPLLHAG